MPTKYRIAFEEVASPITDAVTKFGGQPVWIGEPQWPLSRATGNPMRFICQIELNGIFDTVAAQMAYLFITEEDGDNFVDGTYEANGGENAVILQPGNNEAVVRRLTEGPTLYRMIEGPNSERLTSEPCEFYVELVEEDDIDFVSERDRFAMSEEDAAAVTGKLDENKIGGTPVFMQGDDFPFEGNCQLLLQLDSCTVPFYVNFGDAGVGYAFLNEAGDQAKFLWQCG